MNKWTVSLLILGLASMAPGALKLDYDSAPLLLSVVIEDNDSPVGIDLAVILGDMPVQVEGQARIDLVTFAGGTSLNGQILEAGVLDSIVIPEPATLALMALGGTILFRRR